MADANNGLNLSGGAPAKPPVTTTQSVSLIPEGLKTALIFVLLIAVGFLLYDSYRFQQANKAELARIDEQIKILDKTGEARITSLKGEISQVATSAQEAVGTTKA